MHDEELVMFSVNLNAPVSAMYIIKWNKYNILNLCDALIHFHMLHMNVKPCKYQMGGKKGSFLGDPSMIMLSIVKIGTPSLFCPPPRAPPTPPPPPTPTHKNPIYKTKQKS